MKNFCFPFSAKCFDRNSKCLFYILLNLPSPSPSPSNFALANWNSLQHNPHHVLHWFLYFVQPHWTTSHLKYWIYRTICKVKQIKFKIKLYIQIIILYGSNTLPIKKLRRAATLSKLDNMVNSNSIFTTKYAGFSTKW